MGRAALAQAFLLSVSECLGCVGVLRVIRSTLIVWGYSRIGGIGALLIWEYALGHLGVCFRVFRNRIRETAHGTAMLGLGRT